MEIQLLLVSLESGSGFRVGQDIPLDEVVSFGAGCEAPFEVVGCALAFEFEGFGLEGSGCVVSQGGWLVRGGKS